ncbi:MAG: vanadium-dependent haloperoxidase [Flavobacteriaceae bacterium]
MMKSTIKKNVALLLGVLLFIQCNTSPKSLTAKENPTGADNVAYYWAKTALEATARDTERFSPRPTITSRYLGLIFIAVFDAWSAYDQKATPVYLKQKEKLKGGLLEKEIAISYAAYHTLKEYYFSDSLYYKEQMQKLGLDPSLRSMDLSTPEGIGYAAAKAVIEARKGDGANQYGEEMAGEQPYFDYTHYEPVNPPDQNNDINRWQPKYFINGKGEQYAPGCLTPYWQNVRPIALTTAAQFRSPPPPYYGSEQLQKEVEEVVALQANMTTAEKGLVEFMRDGPKSVQQAGHWLVFAQEVSKRDQHNLDQDVKMYFLNQITAMDAFIASWDTKMFYDYARPYALVHKYFEGKTIQGWGGYEVGWTSLPGEQWRPYSPALFLCPPFPSYVSGHSTVSGACAEALKLFTQSDEFDIKVPFTAGSYTEPEDTWQEITLHFPTFTEAAEMAGISRVLGGYHIQADNIEGLNLGRKVAHQAYAFYLEKIGEKE